MERSQQLLSHGFHKTNELLYNISSECGRYLISLRWIYMLLVSLFNVVRPLRDATCVHAGR